MDEDGPAWFSAKRFGYGAGVPLRWQGWLVVAVYVAVLIGAMNLPQRRLVQLSIIVPATILYMIIAARTTRGGWHWRWGDDE